ncbi:uncharacterized protein LOC108704378 isoform X2 [Xenopus laevis]|nr:uncharacterized protein LOC108704378 isoform X2 [Xenopus laevis]
MSIWMLPENKGTGSHTDGPVIQVPVSSDHSKEEKSASKGTDNGFHSHGDKSQISDPKEQAESSETEKSAFSAQSQDDTRDRAEQNKHPNSSKAKEIGSDVQSQGHTIPDPIEHSHRSDSEDSDIQTLGDTSQLPDPIENSHSSESRNSDVQPQDDKSKATDPIVDSKSSEDRQSGVKSHGQKQISDPTENSQNSEEKKFASNKQSQVDRSQPSDSIEDSQSSKPKKTDVKSQGDKKQISDPTKDSLSSEANDSGYEGTKPQTPNLKKPSAIPDNRTHRKSSSDMESESESKESNLKGLSKGSETKIQVGSTDKDPENVQSHITSQMIDLAKDIEKQLDLMESNQDPSTDGSSLSSPDTSLHHNVSGSAHDVGVQNVPSSGADEKSSQADNNVMVLHPTKFLEERSTTAPSNLKSITSASHHLLITKAPQGNSHNNKPANGQQTPIEKDVKNALSSSRVGSRLSEEHTTTKALKTLHLTNSTKIPDTKSLYKTRTPVLATHSAPSKVFPERRSKATTLFPEPGVHTSKTLIDRVTLKSSDLANPESSFEEDHPDLTQHNAQSDRASKLDTHGATDNFFLEERYGLVAALLFGVVFLLVVIGLVGRKVSQVQRRYQYNKVDYLINGMYVDT